MYPRLTAGLIACALFFLLIEWAHRLEPATSFVGAATISGLAFWVVWKAINAVENNRLIPIEPNYIEAQKRFGIVLGIALAVVAGFLFFEIYSPTWDSVIPYLLIVPGMLTIGFVSGFLGVRVALWCLGAVPSSR